VSDLWLSRIQLRQEAPVAALARLLMPDAADARVAAGHHLIWAAFSDGPDRRRDFLWREEAPGRFLALSARPAVDATGLFTVESRPFEPSLAPGDRLAFALRANAVVSRGATPGGRGKRHDVVMDALRHIPPGPRRAEARPASVISAGREWLARQGERYGFCPSAEVAVDGYETRRLQRGAGRPMSFGVLEFEGVLRVEDPARFLSALANGFGKARAFGCGLMLIRRASG
jgi:CRISPR system Cascade subunit CasE